METLNYIGSKKTLFNTILNVCHNFISDFKNREFADLFAGTGTVAFNMSEYFKKIEANDLEYYSYIINRGLLTCEYTPTLQNIIDICNSLPPVEGLIFQNFSPSETCERMFFTNNNAKKADAIRQYIEKLYNENKISESEYMFLLSSLIVSIDKVANTSSVYGAYLKKIKKSADKNLIMKPIHTKPIINIDNCVFNLDIEELVKNKQFDIVYLDPPYNQRQYSSNYSPLNYIAHYNENIKLTGKTGLIENYNKSNFCSKVKVKKSFENLIHNLNCNYVILSYNNEGILKTEEIKTILMKKGNTVLYKIEYNKFKAQSSVNGNKVEEFLWIVDVNNKNNEFSEIDLELVK